MGIDCPGVQEVVHVGALVGVESYNQETGHGGRDGEPALALVLQKSSSNRYVEESMKAYQSYSKSCRRDCLFQDTDNYVHEDLGIRYLYYDICAHSCVVCVRRDLHNLCIVDSNTTFIIMHSTMSLYKKNHTQQYKFMRSSIQESNSVRVFVGGQQGWGRLDVTEQDNEKSTFEVLLRQNGPFVSSWYIRYSIFNVKSCQYWNDRA